MIPILNPNRKILSKKNNPLSKNFFKTSYRTKNICNEIALPKNHSELISILKELYEQGKTYYVISSGKNIGYGGKVPGISCDILIDLRLLKKIEVCTDDSVVMLQAGVTQQELFDHLVENDLDYYFHISGAPANTSILGNAMAGGYANGVNSIRYDRIVSVKGVYNDGTEFNTHTANNTKYTDLPDIRGLFKGGENGIITEIKFELDPIPEFIQISFFSAGPKEDIKALMDTLGHLKRDGVVTSNISIFNSYRIYAETTGHYCPEDAAKGAAFKDEIYSFLEENNLDFWSGEYNGVIANYYSNKNILQATEDHIQDSVEKHVSKYKSVLLTKSDILRLRKDREAPLPAEAMSAMRGRILTFSGIPKHGSVSMAYWRKKEVNLDTMDIEKDKCGFLWLALSLTPTSTKCMNTITGLEKIVFEHGFEPFYVVDYIRSHEIYIMWSIIYDRNIAGEDAKAARCYKECKKYVESIDITVYRNLNNLVE